MTWGDGGTSNGEIFGIGGGNYYVNSAYTYRRFGTYNVALRIADSRGGSVTAGSTAKVADAPIIVARFSGATATVGQLWGPYNVNCIADDNPYGVASDLSATIKWGDGTSSTGTIKAVNNDSTCPGNDFAVRGSHTYKKAGTYTQTVIASSVGGSKDTGTGTIKVSP